MVFKEYSKVFQTIQKYHHGRQAITVAWYVLFGLMDNNTLNRQIQLAYKMWRFALTPLKALYFLIGNSCPLLVVFSMKYEWALFFCWNRCLKTLSKIRKTSNHRPLLVNLCLTYLTRLLRLENNIFSLYYTTLKRYLTWDFITYYT